jgi:hypothetical protein
VISRRFFEAFLALLAISSGQTLAQTSTESRVEKLEKTVRLLERRVATLEDHLRQRNAALSVLSDKANWRKLQKGLSETDVEKLLGSPSKVDAFGSFTIWHYGYPSGGQVQFDGTSRTVRGWHEP